MRRLSTQILVMQLAILLVTAAAGFLLSAHVVARELDHQYQQRALAVANSVAALPQVPEALAAGEPRRNSPLARLAADVRRTSNVAYVVIADRQGIRYSHPNTELIGKRVSTPPTPVLTGQDWVGIQTGTLGRSARGKSPVTGPDGTVIGEVSVGILEERVSDKLLAELPTVAVYTLAALALGALASFGLARRLKRQTFGLELDEISDLLQEREATLHGIREGVVVCSRSGEIRLVNDEARRLLELPESCVGRPLAEAFPPGRLRDVLTGAARGPDEYVLTGLRLLVVNRMPVQVSGRDIGSVVTLRDRTEAEGLLRELDSVRSLTDALRAQAHEFRNRLHTIAGLLELERYQEVKAFVAEIGANRAGHAGLLVERLGHPVLVALLLAKTAVAAERGVDLLLSPASTGVVGVEEVSDVVTVVGNLVDNAIDAAATTHGGWVEVRIGVAGGDLTIEIADSGPGVPPDARERVFDLGWSTKHSLSGASRGMGLALVRQVAQRRGGTVTVTGERGAVFRASLPLALPHEPPVACPPRQEVRLP